MTEVQMTLTMQMILRLNNVKERDTKKRQKGGMRHK